MVARALTARSNAGRPSRQQAGDALGNIVRTACLHFARHGIRGSNNRDIARDAGVTPAMIPYYFKRRQDLHLAVLETAFAPLLSGLPATTTLESWAHYFHSYLCERPWLPHLMIREVLPADGGLRMLFVKRFAPTLFGHVHALVESASKQLKLRRGFDIDRHVVLLMGMLVYPFMTLQIAQDLSGRKFDTTMMAGFRDDALRLFLQGITARQVRSR